MGRIEDALQLSAPAVLNIKIIKLQVQWPTEYQTSSVFEWSILAGPRHLKTGHSCPFFYLDRFIK
jgi:hypothetical protein